MLPGPRILLGPGPSMADPRVLRALATPLLGQFDPEFTAIMNDVMDLSRFVFRTANARTYPVSGTGRAGMEAAMVSLIEPDDRDAVVTLGGTDVAVDRWGVDVATAGSQKCLSCPSGMAPITYNARAEAIIRARKTKVASNYLDLGQLADYWSPARFNHHTAPTAMVYGLREALRAVREEGLAARFARHRLHGDALRAGIDALGLSLFGKEPPERRLPFITPV